MKWRFGQGIVESVFAVGMLGILLGGAVILIVMGLYSRNSSFSRRRANELANTVMENLISQSRNEPLSFWTLTRVDNQKLDQYEGYVYSVGYTNITNNAIYPQCGIGRTDCAEAVVGVGWSGKEVQNFYLNRFFSKYD